MFPFHLTILFLQKKCQILKKGSLRASSGKYLTRRRSLYSRCRLCPRAECPNQFRLSYCPKLPASSTSFSTSLPRFTSGGTMSLLSSSPNTSFMIYITAPANSHSPNRLSSSCKSHYILSNTNIRLEILMSRNTMAAAKLKMTSS